MTEPAWSRRARKRIEGQRVVVVGIGVDQMRGFVEAGANVVGAVAVLPAGGPAAVFDEAFPVLVLQGTSRDILAHVVGGYAAAIGRAESDVARFLDEVDPDRSAAVAGYLPIPHAVLNGRRPWTADSAISTVLEAKVGAATPLAATVRVIPTIPLPAGTAHDWWPRVCEQFDADRLVVQVAGLSGGGTGTFVCDGPAAVPVGIHGFVSPFVDGLPANVMGVVDDTGATIVLPASRQLLRSDDRGRPLYAGNITGEHWVTDHRNALGDEVRAIGRSLAATGFSARSASTSSSMPTDAAGSMT